MDCCRAISSSISLMGSGLSWDQCSWHCTLTTTGNGDAVIHLCTVACLIKTEVINQLVSARFGLWKEWVYGVLKGTSVRYSSALVGAYLFVQFCWLVPGCVSSYVGTGSCPCLLEISFFLEVFRRRNIFT